MRNLITSFLMTITLSVSQFVFAHGQDKPGPHGGAVQMPGAFHTEVVDKKDGSFSVYLLDINFQNPSVKDASVKAQVETSGKRSNLACEEKVDHFICKGKRAQSGSRLLITATREKAQGNEVAYALPVKIEKEGGAM